MKYTTVIGLEVHAELKTQSKIYCGCSTQFGKAENTNVCPVCTGMPGVLPVINKQAVEYVLRTGLALGCKIGNYSRQDRKHYFYPDLPKAFQTSQYDLPLCGLGRLDFEVDDQPSSVGITRVHIEEDAGKLIHGAGVTRVDYNRCGVPLMEIVTEPDIRSAQQARVFLETLRALLLFIGVSDCRMQEGSLRCDVNISVMPEGSDVFGTRTEIKNLNSFRTVARAIECERDRQIQVLESGGKILRQTLHWDDVKGNNRPLRTKEQENDYLYFPEPDIMPMVISDEWLQATRDALPEMPHAKRKRYLAEYGMSEKDAALMVSSVAFARLFEDAIAAGLAPATAANFIKGSVSRILRERAMDAEDLPLQGAQLFQLFQLIQAGTISHTIADKVLEKLFDTPESTPQAIIEKHGMVQISDTGAIEALCAQAIEGNAKAVADYRAGKQKAITSLVGFVMKQSRGKANPQLVNEILSRMLAE